MRFKGKIDWWLWLILILGEASIVGCFLDSGRGSVIIWISFLIYNFIFLPFIFRNYVEVTEDKMVVAFGFYKQSMLLSELQEVYRTNNPISSTAASLDRIVLKGNNKSMLCAIRKKEEFFELLRKQNPDIKIQEKKQYLGNGKTGKISAIFSFVIVILVGILLFTGNITMEYGEGEFMVKASYYPDKKIAYKDIEEIYYQEEKVDGSRVGGFGSFRLLMGSFKNEAFGNYERYTYKDCDAAVVLIVNGKEVVLSGKDEESTYQIYEELLKRCQNSC